MTSKRSYFCKGEHCKCETYWTVDWEGFWVCNNCGRKEKKRDYKHNLDANREMSPSQKDALESFRHFLESDLDEKYAEQVTKFDTEANTYQNSFWVSADVEMTGLSESSLLRALSHERWHVLIGPRGKLEAHSYPDSYKQFKGKKHYSGITFK